MNTTKRFPYVPVFSVLVLLATTSASFGQGALDELEKTIDDEPPKSALDELEGGLDDVLPSSPLPAPRADREDGLPGFLGLFTDDRSTTASGIPVVSVTPDGPAQTAGIRVGDRIRFINDNPVGSNEDIARILSGARAGDIVAINLTRGREVMTAKVVLGVRDESLPIDEGGEESRLRPGPAPVGGDRATLGVSVSPVDPSRPGGFVVSQGALITNVQPGSPALLHGLTSGDVIVAVDGRRIDSPSDLVRCISMTRPGETIDVSYYRGVRLYRRPVELTWRDTTVAGGAIPGAAPGTPVGEDRPVLRMLDGILGRVAPGAVPPLSNIIPPRNSTPGAGLDAPPIISPTPAPIPGPTPAPIPETVSPTSPPNSPPRSRADELLRLKSEMDLLRAQMERIQSRIIELEGER